MTKKNDLGSLIALVLAFVALLFGITSMVIEEHYVEKLSILERDEGLKAKNFAECGTTWACPYVAPEAQATADPGPELPR